jgi:hypothetical protein
MAAASSQLLFDFDDDTIDIVQGNNALSVSIRSTQTNRNSNTHIIAFPSRLPFSRTERVSFPHEFSFRPFGAWVDFGKRLSASERLEANNKAIELLRKPAIELSAGDIQILRRYSGWGGLSAANERGVLYDYYTSPPIAGMTWRLLNKVQPINGKARILEPSCGTGVFFETAPPHLELHGIELDGRTAAIASRVHPAAHIENKSYEAFNISRDTNVFFDHIIGNIPFGERTLETAYLDMRDEKSLDRYFVSRSLDNLKPEGTLAVIVHPSILENKSNESWRLSLCAKAQFMGAVKLNNDSFHHTHTAIQPDILLFKKHPHDIQERLQTFSPEKLNELEIINPEWVYGSYFIMHPDYIMGTVKTGKGQWGSDIVSGTVTPQTIRSIVDTFIPETPFTNATYNRIRECIPLSVKTVKTSNLSLSEDELELVDQKALVIGNIKTVDNAIYMLCDSYRWNLIINNNSELVERVSQVIVISKDIKTIRRYMRDGEKPEALQSGVKILLAAYRDRFGFYPKDDNLINRLLRNYPSVSGIYDALIAPDAGILNTDNLYDKRGDTVNGHNRAVEALLFLQQRFLDGTTDIIQKYFPEESNDLIAEMYRNADIFLGTDNNWQLREDFISGNAWQKIDSLNKLIARESESAKRDKWRYGIEELEKAIGWIPIEDADFSPHSSWIPEYVINNWVGDKDGLNRVIYSGSLSRNEEGKWGIRYDSDKTLSVKGSRDERKVYRGQWAELADEIVYYLNMQKQRSRYNDTEIYNREHNENFKNYIANHKTYRDELERLYNHIFNTEIAVPVKVYPVYLEGWRTESKTLKAHQWQSVHHLYRTSKGISALGTGFGKTLAATGLHALLQQEGRIKRAWFQVPNNKVKDWIKEIHDVLPKRSIGFVDPEMPGYSNRDKRYTLYQYLASSDYDIILMPESSGSEIQLSPEQDEIITSEVIIKHVAEKGEGKSERKIETLKESVSRKLQNGRTNRTISFDDFGCDFTPLGRHH